MSVTIYEIAERAGVSSSTVARILRGDARNSYRRSVETAERMRQIAREMGYRPNLRARAFSRGRTRGIGLLYTDDAWIFEGVNTEVVNSLVRTLQQEGHHLVFCPIDDRRRLAGDRAGRADRRRRGVSDAAGRSGARPSASEICRSCCWATTAIRRCRRWWSTTLRAPSPPRSI